MQALRARPAVAELPTVPATRRRVLAGFLTSPAGVAVSLVVLAGVSTLLRVEGQAQWFWIDEGLSEGIAAHPFTEIPRLLRQDGSPPLYFLAFHGWVRVFGTSEVAGHAFSLVLAQAAIPIGLWAGWSLFGRRAGWMCALLVAFNPFLTYYGREARMYTLVALLALVATTAFVHVFVFRRRRYLPLLTAATVLLLYTHNWALFFVLGAIAALIPCALVHRDRARLCRDGLIAFGIAGVLYLPWLPTLLYQLAHTGAPWSRVPTAREAVSELSAVLGDERVLVALLLVGGAGLVPVLRRFRTAEAAAVLGPLVLVVVPVGASWLTSQFEPNWATRYFALVVGATLLVAAAGLARAGVQGLAALVLILLFWTHPLGRVTGLHDDVNRNQKSNVKALTATFAPRLRPRDLILVTHPEQVSVVRYYFGPTFRFATPMGLVADPRVVDWRDIVDRLAAARTPTHLEPLVDDLPVGGRVLLLAPIGREPTDEQQRRQDPAWFKLFRRRSAEWLVALRADDRLRLVHAKGDVDDEVSGTSLYGRLFEKVAR